MNIKLGQEIILLIGMVFLAITASLCLVRAILGPRFTDRVLSINVINVKVIILICMLAAYKNKSYLVDISLLYSAISFLSVVVLARLFLRNYLNENKKVIGRVDRNGSN